MLRINFNIRYGFQGQEQDDEIKGEGNSINYKYRMHDSGFEGQGGSPAVRSSPFLLAAIGGTQQIDAKIKVISATDIQVNYTLWDRYGGGEGDATSWLPGLPYLYWLQHNSHVEDNAPMNQFVPFIWNFNINR